MVERIRHESLVCRIGNRDRNGVYPTVKMNVSVVVPEDIGDNERKCPVLSKKCEKCGRQRHFVVKYLTRKRSFTEANGVSRGRFQENENSSDP